MKYRKLNEDFIEKLNSSKLLKAVKEDKDLVIGIRNDSINVYYKHASIGRVSFSRNKFFITLCKKYLPGTSQPLSEDLFLQNIKFIKENVDSIQNSKEDIAQQNLILNNAKNPYSEWVCVDLEYVRHCESNGIAKFGRFDVVAISKSKDLNGKYKVALIELKVGNQSYATSINGRSLRERVKKGLFDITTEDEKLGSGLLGHLADFYRFIDRNVYACFFKIDLCHIIRSLASLSLIDSSYNNIDVEELFDVPEIYLITLENNRKVENSFITQMYKGKEASVYNVEKVLGHDFIKDNYHFLFTESEAKDIHNIVEDKKYKEFDIKRKTWK